MKHHLRKYLDSTKLPTRSFTVMKLDPVRYNASLNAVNLIQRLIYRNKLRRSPPQGILSAFYVKSRAGLAASQDAVRYSTCTYIHIYVLIYVRPVVSFCPIDIPRASLNFDYPSRCEINRRRPMPELDVRADPTIPTAR